MVPLLAAVVVGLDAEGAPAPADAVSGCEALARSSAVGVVDVLAAVSAAGGAVIAASVPTSNFRSTGVFTPGVRSSSLVAGEKPSCEISTRKWASGSAGNSNVPSSSVHVTHALPVDVWMTRSVAPGTAVPSAVRTVPANCESPEVSASPLSCAASGTPNTTSSANTPASNTASLLPSNVHAPSILYLSIP